MLRKSFQIYLSENIYAGIEEKFPFRWEIPLNLVGLLYMLQQGTDNVLFPKWLGEVLVHARI